MFYSLIFATFYIILQFNYVHGTYSLRDAINRVVDTNAFLAAEKVIITKATPDQVKLLKAAIPVCMSLTDTQLQSFVQQSLAYYSTPNGRKKRSISRHKRFSSNMFEDDEIFYDSVKREFTDDVKTVAQETTQFLAKISPNILHAFTERIQQANDGDDAAAKDFISTIVESLISCATIKSKAKRFESPDFILDADW